MDPKMPGAERELMRDEAINLFNSRCADIRGGSASPEDGKYMAALLAFFAERNLLIDDFFINDVARALQQDHFYRILESMRSQMGADVYTELKNELDMISRGDHGRANYPYYERSQFNLAVKAARDSGKF